MKRTNLSTSLTIVAVFALAAAGLSAIYSGTADAQNPTQPDNEKVKKPSALVERTYEFSLADPNFNQVFKKDSEAKVGVMDAQQSLLDKRYDLSDQPSKVMMSGGRKAVQEGVRVKLHGNATWGELAEMTPQAIRKADLFPMAFRPLPHAKHATGGMVFPKEHIKAIADDEGRDLERFDVEYDLPVHLTPEFPPPIFLQNRPELGDVSQGKVLTIKNFNDLMDGKLTPVQLDGLRLLLTPFPQQQFNMTGDRKVKTQQLGVACLDCHTNGHTNAAFHLNPDTRPSSRRFRLDTPSLRGMFNQRIHGSKRSLRSVEDFTEFEQRTAYFDGDHVVAMKKGANLPNRTEQVSMMAQMQNMFDFPPAPKLDRFGRLDPRKASKDELAGEVIFFGKGRCASCHQPPTFMDQQMHDLRLGEFYDPQTIGDQFNIASGAIKTFTLRGIKDSPPYLHDGRLLTLDDTVEFFSLVLGLQLGKEEKQQLVAYMRCL